MLVKAVAHHTTASFIRVNGSEFVQKYLGEGPRMVRDVFRMARENSPSIIFIDEVRRTLLFFLGLGRSRFVASCGRSLEMRYSDAY